MFNKVHPQEWNCPVLLASRVFVCPVHQQVQCLAYTAGTVRHSSCFPHQSLSLIGVLAPTAGSSISRHSLCGSCVRTVIS